MVNLWPIFVYGTLKKGEPNHYLLNNKNNGVCISYADYHVSYLGQNNDKYILTGLKFQTSENFCLGVDYDRYDEDSSNDAPFTEEKDIGNYLIPFMIDDKDHAFSQKIQGEVYYIDQNMQDFLDVFEGHPGVYQRTAIDIELMIEKKDHTIFIEQVPCYLLRKERFDENKKILDKKEYSAAEHQRRISQ